jgi:hypothetical protein
MQNSHKRLWSLLSIAAAGLAALIVALPAIASHKDTTLVIWTDQDRQAAVTLLANQ